MARLSSRGSAEPLATRIPRQVRQQILFNSLQQRIRNAIRKARSLLRALLLRRGISLDENRTRPQRSRCLDIRNRVPDHHAVRRRRPRKIPKSLQEHPRPRLAAITLPNIVGTIVESIDARPTLSQMPLQLRMKGLHISLRVNPQRDTALVADYDHAASGAIERGNRSLHSR